MTASDILTRLAARGLVIVIAAAYGCTDSGSGPGPLHINLLVNSSFEKDREPSLTGWRTDNPDTAYVSFSGDVPPDGGKYSVRLLNTWTSPGTITAAVLPRPGIHFYRLSAWGKASKSGLMNAGGSMILSVRQSGRDSVLQSVHFGDTVWTFAQFYRLIPSEAADTILVRLEGNLDQWSDGHILFDLCTLDIDDKYFIY